jgi:hypothetical protein
VGVFVGVLAACLLFVVVLAIVADRRRRRRHEAADAAAPDAGQWAVTWGRGLNNGSSTATGSHAGWDVRVVRLGGNGANVTQIEIFYRATGRPPKLLWNDGQLRRTGPARLDALPPADAVRLQRMGIHQVRLGVVPIGRRRGTPFLRALHRGWLEVPFFPPVLDELVVILDDLRRQGTIQQR